MHRNSEIPCIIGEIDLIEGEPECNKKRSGGAEEEGWGHFKSCRMKQIS